MKKIIRFILSIIMFALMTISVNADDIVYSYSEWSYNYPTGVNIHLIESEDRYLFYKEYTLDDGTIIRDTTDEYYTSYQDYSKLEETKTTYYRYILNQYVVINGSYTVITDSSYCQKQICYVLENNPNIEPVEEKEEPEVMINPQTYDYLFIYLIVGFISIVLLTILCSKKSSFVESI